jgi:2-oxoglutarate dehydrogenase E2 component (dihydrolipoamide succinyltransferase)
MQFNWKKSLLAIAAVLTLALSGCGKPDMASQTKRYTEAKDRIEAYATKNPLMKADIQKKITEFEAEFKKAESSGGEQGAGEIGALISRMEKYEKELKPEQKPAPAQATPSAPAPGAKLAAPATPTPAGVAPAPAAVAPAPVPAAVAPAPAAGGKLGIAPSPTPAPATPPANSGFGGK